MKKIILSIDIQNEYITSGRPFCINSINQSLQNAALVIIQSRKSGIPVWHVKHEQTDRIFIKGHELTNFILSCAPEKNEKVFSKDLYSCFSSDAFKKAIETEKPDEIFIIGYGSSMCCLCTIIDGIHRGYQFTIIEDATASKANKDISESDMHHSAIAILQQYAKVISTNDFIHDCKK